MYFGIDIGGMSIKIGAFKNDKLIDKWTIKLDFITADQMAKCVIDSISDKYPNEDINGIGIGCPGFITMGYISRSANIPFLNDVNLFNVFKKYTDAKIVVLNDANAAGLGEALYEAYSNAMFVTLGTGVGGALVINRQVFEGVHGCGMEFGHFYVDDKYSFTCGCGARGCLETVASATGLLRLVEANRKNYKTSLGDKVEAKDVFDAAKNNDELALACVNEFASYLGKALADVSIIVDPGHIIIGGGVSNAGDFLLTKIKTAYQARVNKAVSDTEISLAKLGNDAGIYGAYYSVKD